MVSQLTDRLTDLAGHTPAGTPPPDLWSRGVRRRRAGQALTSLVVVVLLLLVGAGGIAWHGQQRLQPTAPQGKAQLPDRFYAPSPWLSGFDRPPGPLVAILPSERDSLFHLEARLGLVGITASTSSYGFLDLPGSALVTQDSNMLALSPRGTSVAFWVTGQTSGRPNTEMVNGVTVTGVGIYDTVTGESRIQPIPSQHGVMPNGLLWTDDSTLVLAYSRITDDGSGGGSHAVFVGAERWDADAAHPVLLPAGTVTADLSPSWTSAASGVLWTQARGRNWQLVDPHRPTGAQLSQVVHAAQFPALSPDRGTVVGLRNPGATQQGDTEPLVAARIVPSHVHDRAVTSFAKVPAGDQWYATVGWAGDRHAVALRSLPDAVSLSGQVFAELDRVDVHTGSYTKLADVEAGGNVAQPYNELMARSLLGAPVVHASPPPRPVSHRLIAGLVVMIVVLGLVLIRRTRRGRRA